MTRLAVVGAGQVGTMLGMALRSTRRARGSGPEVVLYDLDRSVAEVSLARGAGDAIASSMDEALGADALILAVPVPDIVSVLDEHGARLRQGILVMDTGSTKRVVAEAMRRHVPSATHVIGGHPMAGAERPGPEGADPTVLRDAPFVVTPVRDDSEAIGLATALVRDVGATPVVIEPDLHDRIVARTSHLPHLVSFALLRGATADGDPSGFVHALTGPGFRGATRLAASDPRMVAGFLWANRDEVRRAARSFGRELESLVAALDIGPAELERALTAAAGGIRP